MCRYDVCAMGMCGEMECGWMHGRDPHARVAFGLGRSRAAGGAGKTEVESLQLQLRRPALLLLKEAKRCRGRELLPVSGGPPAGLRRSREDRG